MPWKQFRRELHEPRHLTVVTGDRMPTDEIVAIADRVEGRLLHPQIGDVFREADILVKLSRLEGMAGPPLEAFHCGATAVMAPVTGHDEYGQHGVNCMLVGYDDVVGTARTLDLLARDRPFLDRLRTNALETARQWPDWEEATAALAAVIDDIAELPPQVDSGYLRQLIDETHSLYLRQSTLEERAEATQSTFAKRVLWVWRHEGTRGVAIRVGRRSRTARRVRSSVRSIRSRLKSGQSHVDMQSSSDSEPPENDSSRGVVDGTIAPGHGVGGRDGADRLAAIFDETRVVDDESRLIFLHEYVPRQGDVVVDAGAGNGVEVVTLSHLVGPLGKVIAVEAHPCAFGTLRALCESKSLHNVELIHAALTATPGMTQISDLDDPLLNSTVRGAPRTLDVAATTLDDLMRQLGIHDIDFLKMNIEGAEVNALEGFTRGIERTRHVCIGCHDFLTESERGGEEMRTKESVRTILERAGFAVTSQSHELPWIADYLYGASSK